MTDKEKAAEEYRNNTAFPIFREDAEITYSHMKRAFLAGWDACERKALESFGFSISLTSLLNEFQKKQQERIQKLEAKLAAYEKNN